MKSKHFFKWMIAGASFAALAAACGDDSATDPPGTGGAGGTTSSTTTATGMTTTTTTTTTTGPGGAGGAGGVPDDGNNSFDTAEELTIDAGGVMADLDPLDTDRDFFVFEGTAGQVISVATDAKPSDDPSAADSPDLVITLYNEAEEQIAQNDDTVSGLIQDSLLYTILPATGKYFVRVEEFCASDLATQACPDDYYAAITDKTYLVGVGSIDAADNGNVRNEEGLITPMEYEPTGTPGSYFSSLVYGDFVDAADSDVYSFNLPDDIVVAERTLGHAELQIAGVDGNGSTTSPGIVQFINATTLEVVAEVDAGFGGELSPPLNPLIDYQLVVTHPGGAEPVGPTAFYFLLHRAGDSNPVEAEIGTGLNDSVATSEDLIASEQSYFTEGDLIPAGPLDIADQDYFSVDVPPGMTKFSISCGGQRSGSGLRGLKASVLKGSDGAAVPMATATETEVADLLLQNSAVPAGETSLVVKIEAASQAATVTSTFYRCGFHFNP
jgi:hypothetical protein